MDIYMHANILITVICTFLYRSTGVWAVRCFHLTGVALRSFSLYKHPTFVLLLAVFLNFLRRRRIAKVLSL
jgi:hypothetical protein